MSELEKARSEWEKVEVAWLSARADVSRMEGEMQAARKRMGDAADKAQRALANYKRVLADMASAKEDT